MSRWALVAACIAVAGCGHESDPAAQGGASTGAASPCRVVETTPAFDATGVAIVGPMTVRWSSAVDASTVAGQIELRVLGGEAVPVVVTPSAADEVTVEPAASLWFWSQYALTVGGGVLSASGDACDGEDVAFSTLEPEAAEQPLHAAAANGLARVQDAVLVASRTYRGLQVFDVSDPAHVELVGAVPLAASPESIQVSGDRAYVACGWDGVLVFDVSDRWQPVLLGHAGTPGYARDVAPYSQGGRDYLAIADSHEGVRLADVTDGAAPRDLGGFDWSDADGSYFWAVDVRDGVLAIADGNRGLLLASLADPELPLWMSTTDAGYPANDVALDGHIAYVALGAVGIRSFDVTDPSVPTEVEHLDGPSGPCSSIPCWDFMQGLVVSEGELLAATGTVGIARVALDGAGGMAFARVFDVPGQGRAVGGNATHLFAASEAGLATFARAAPSDSSPLWVDETSHGLASAVGVADGYAYVAAGGVGLQTFSLADPEAPLLVDRDDTPGAHLTQGAEDVLLAPGLLILSDAAGATTIFDRSDPADPIPIAAVAGDDNVVSAALEGTTLFICQSNAGLVVVDIADPAAPMELARVAVPPAHLACWDLRVAGDVLYVGGAQGIGVVDVADPTLPVWLGWTELPTHDIVNDIVLADGYLYAGSIVTDWEGTGSVAHRLDVFSLADPLAPELVWRSAELGGVGELLVFGDTAFLAAGGEGVLVWDVGDPTHPELQGAIATSGSPRGLAVSGEYLLAAQGGGGLLPIHVGALPAP